MRLPEGLQPRGRGRRFWKAVTEAFEFRADELALLVEVCKVLDTIDRLEGDLEGGPSIVVGSRGQPALNPGIAELRQQRALLGRLLAQLNIPEDGEEPQSAGVLSPRSVRGRRAAAARWRNHHAAS